MTIYFVLISCILLCVGLKPNLSKQRRKIFLWISFGAMLIISGFRGYSVGADTKSYIALFNNIQNYNFESSRYEVGFLYYLKFIRFLSDDPTLFLLISSAICIGITCIFIYRYSDDPLQSVLLYILLKSYFFQMTGIRQAIASSIVMLAFMFIIERQEVKRVILAALLILLSSSFHKIAIVAYIPMVIWILHWKNTTKQFRVGRTILYTFIASVAVFVFYPIVMSLVGYVAPRFTLYFSGTWSDSNYNASLFNMLINIVFLLIGAIFISRKEITNNISFSMMMLSFAVVFSVLSMRMEIWERVTRLFSVYTSIMWAPDFTAMISKAYNRLTVKFLIFVFSLLYMIVTLIFRPEWDGVVPYLFR